MLRHTITALLFVLVALLHVGCATVQPSDALPEMTPQPAVESPVTENDTEAEDEDLSDKVIVAVTEDYTLIYPAEFARLVPLEVILWNIDQSYKRVEALLGEFTERVEIFVPMQITAEGLPPGLTIQGVTYVEDKQIKVAVALPWANVEVFSHELLHARLRNLKLQPPRWLEEGLAHSVESENGFNSELYQLLVEHGPLTLEELKKLEHGVGEDEMRFRATGWAVAYYLMKVKGHSVEEIAKATSLPDPQVAVAAVRADHEPVVASVK